MNTSHLEVLLEIIGEEQMALMLLKGKKYIESTKEPDVKAMEIYQKLHNFYISKFGRLPEILQQKPEIY